MRVMVKTAGRRVRDYSGTLIKAEAIEKEQRLYSGEAHHVLIGYDVKMRMDDGAVLLISGVQNEHIKITP